MEWSLSIGQHICLHPYIKFFPVKTAIYARVLLIGILMALVHGIGLLRWAIAAVTRWH